MDKISRLASMMRSGSNPEFESVEDTCVDILNYTGLFWESYNRSRFIPNSEFPAVLPGVSKQTIKDFESNYFGVGFD